MEFLAERKVLKKMYYRPIGGIFPDEDIENVSLKAPTSDYQKTPLWACCLEVITLVPVNENNEDTERRRQIDCILCDDIIFDKKMDEPVRSDLASIHIKVCDASRDTFERASFKVLNEISRLDKGTGLTRDKFNRLLEPFEWLDGKSGQDLMNDFEISKAMPPVGNAPPPPLPLPVLPPPPMAAPLAPAQEEEVHVPLIPILPILQDVEIAPQPVLPLWMNAGILGFSVLLMIGFYFVARWYVNMLDETCSFLLEAFTDLHNSISDSFDGESIEGEVSSQENSNI